MGPRTQDVSRMYIRLSEDVQDVPWKSYIRSIYDLYPEGMPVRILIIFWWSIHTTYIYIWSDAL